VRELNEIVVIRRKFMACGARLKRFLWENEEEWGVFDGDLMALFEGGRARRGRECKLGDMD
jgi:hypothetical protein